MTQFFNQVVCLECNHEMVADLHTATCAKCGSLWLDARYDYDAVLKLWTEDDVVRKRDRSLWRYGELLPIVEPNPEISMGEGYTPLIRLYQYERMFNHEGIYIKDERHQPTNSFKDRQAALAVTSMKMAGIKECVLASTGNAAVAYAAYCARAGIKLWVFLTSLAPPEKMREVALYGAEVVNVSGTYDETKKVAAEFAQRKGIPMDKGAKTIPAKESMKTLGYEIAEQLGLQLHPNEQGKWRAPDWYIQAVSGGIGPIGAWKGFSELYQMGLIDKMPKLGIVQAMGCSPMVTAFNEGKDTAEAVIPKTLIHVLATGDPGYAYVQLHEAVKSNDGVMIAVEDGATFTSMRLLASRAGISVEPATAVAFAGLEKMLTENIIVDGEVVVLNCSGHTMPAESHILGDQYDKYILSFDSKHVKNPQDADLGAALETLDEQVTTVVIVDDNPNDRRLIRRLLQSYKNYRVYEAYDGESAIKVIQDRKPDMVVTDLTMPELDGFGLLKAIKDNPDTAHIPVVVISAKSLSLQDRKMLDDYSESVWTKGSFDTRQLVDHVVSTLGHTPVDVKEVKTRQKNKSFVGHATQPIDLNLLTKDDDESHLVILIEDNPSDARLIHKMLKSDKSYHILDASTGREGLKLIYKYHPELVILDLLLPDMDGFSIIDTLQNDVKLRDIPVIIVTGKDLTQGEQQTLHDSIHRTIKKASLDRKELLGIINNKLS